MFSDNLSVLAVAGLVGLSAGAIAYAILYDKLSGEAAQEKRMAAVGTRDNSARKSAEKRLADANKRKLNVQESLKELQDDTARRQGFTLKQLLRQAGLSISPQKYYMGSLIAALLGAFAAGAGTGFSFIMMGLAFVICGLGLPRFWLMRKRKKRLNAFVDEFPNAIDVIVRGVRAGLPINDCLRIISQEAKEPVAGEFRRICDAQKMGVTTSEAVGKLYESIPISDANFFSIVITIQQQAGGNLSESLSNLSKVLRDRKKLKAKVQAMSAEAKASAMIIGALPIIVGCAVFFTSPDYIMILFNDPVGNILLAISAAMMTMGVLVMRQMINFDF